MDHHNSYDYKAEILAGLHSIPKKISSSFFYDDIGSELFEEITKLPEYYPPDTEKPLLKELADYLKPELDNIDLIEIGSGDCSKISILLDAIKNISSARYIPFDISEDAILKSANILNERYNSLNIHGMVADFYSHLELIPNGKKRIFCFFGSTIGNLDQNEAITFLKEISAHMTQQDYLIVGFDMVKEIEVLYKAYNDVRGVTAKFNLNILNVVNNHIGSDFNLDDFEHCAFYNEDQNRIEMHLKAKHNLSVFLPNQPDLFVAKDETIHTENSYKFTIPIIRELADNSNLIINKIFTDDKNWFSEILLTKK